MGKENKVNPKSEDNSKVKKDLRPAMMFLVETGNRNPHVKKHDLQQSAKMKENIWNAKMTNVKL